MTKSEFCAEFERRTGYRMLDKKFQRDTFIADRIYFAIWKQGDKTAPGMHIDSVTKSIYSRAHLEAAIEAVNRREKR
jgi:hypothetical protein